MEPPPYLCDFAPPTLPSLDRRISDEQSSAVHRVQFTEEDDELLARGIMQYNTDWNKIQQLFLPTKTAHQIFIRQKNRCCSRAPDNPVKAVRHMKSSPLTSEEIALVNEGLNIYKNDWISIWKFMLPRRDPSLLPRQWRIANGTQKSYKGDAAMKEKRRAYRLSKQRNWQEREARRLFHHVEFHAKPIYFKPLPFDDLLTRVEEIFYVSNLQVSPSLLKPIDYESNCVGHYVDPGSQSCGCFHVLPLLNGIDLDETQCLMI